jgi:hypothetical protein
MKNIVCTTISSTDANDFDLQVTNELNYEKWEGYFYQIVFIQDENTFYAHIVFTKNTHYCDLNNLK